MPQKVSSSIESHFALTAHYVSKYFLDSKSVILTCCLLPFSHTVLAFDYGDPTILEQSHLEMINRARSNPESEAKRFNLDLLEGTKPGQIDYSTKQPLSFNAALLTTARNHSNTMLNANFFEHTDQANHSPWDRFKAINYNYSSANENIAMIGRTSSLNVIETNSELYRNLLIDNEYQNRQHRVNLFNPKYREIGIGLSLGIWHEANHSFNSALLTTDFGLRTNGRPIVLGVVYDDQNKNNLYDPGEGIPGITIAISQNLTTTSASAGGFGLEVDPHHDYTLTFTHPVYGTLTRDVHVNDLNVKVDVLLNEFPNPSPDIIRQNSSSNADQQCPSFEQNQLQIPCVSAAGQPFQIELGAIGATDNHKFTLGIRSLSSSQPASLVSCDVYDPVLQKAFLRCVKRDNKNYRAELTVSGSPNPVIKLELLESSGAYFVY